MANKLNPKETMPSECDELLAEQALQPELESHIELIRKAFNLIALALDTAPVLSLKHVSQSRKVVSALLARLATDIRSATLLAIKGYPLQAASIVASSYEAVFTLAYIGSDDVLAQKWIDHADPTCTPFKDIKKLTRNALRKMEVPDPDKQAASEYRIYRQLCWAKHVNPILQKLHGPKVVNGAVYQINGPDASESAVRTAWFSLEEAAHLTYLALFSFTANHIPAKARKGLMIKANEIGAEKRRLMQAANQRWGTEDPFPGQWQV